MGYLFIIAPIALQIACIVHAVRNGNTFPWIFIIFFLPGLGSAAYLLVEVLPGFLNSRHARGAASNLGRLANPNAGLRQAHRDVSLVGSVAAKRNLAEEYMQRGQYADAVAIFTDALQGQFSDDTSLWFGLARAQFLAGDGAGTQHSLDTIQKLDPKFISADAHMLYARALEMQGKDDEALAEYAKLVPYFSGEEARARYGLLLKKVGRTAEARALFEEILKLMDGAPRHYIRAQREWRDIARQNLS